MTLNSFEITTNLSKIIAKIQKKDLAMYNSIFNKIDDIVNTQNLNHYKNLKKPLNHLKRVHINKSFVLVFSVKESHIIFEDFAHHNTINNIYILNYILITYVTKL